MAETMIERVARVMAERDIRVARRWDTDPEKLEEMMPAAVDHHWPSLVDDARATIEAMREPDQAMRLASKRYKRTAKVYSGPECFRKMIDAALTQA